MFDLLLWILKRAGMVMGRKRMVVECLGSVVVAMPSHFVDGTNRSEGGCMKHQFPQMESFGVFGIFITRGR